MRKMTPVNSNHNWCSTLPNDLAVVRAAAIAAENVRLRPTCCPATLATMPALRQVEILLTTTILTACRATMGDTLHDPGFVRPGEFKHADVGRRRLWLHQTVVPRGASNQEKGIMQTSGPDLDQLKSRLKATWMAGDFGQIANFTRKGGGEFRRPARYWLQDQKCWMLLVGTGNTAIPAARAGAEVVGVDIATNLLEQAAGSAQRPRT